MLGAPNRARAAAEGVRMRPTCALSAASGSGVSSAPKKARGLDEPRLIGLDGKREYPSLALWRAGFLKRAARQRRDRLARSASAAADSDGDDPAHGLTSRHCTIGIAARQPE